MITTGSLGSGDTASWTETYDNKNVGATHVMTPAGIVNDGNSGNNYNVTDVAINTGIINPAPASVTPNAASAAYGAPDSAVSRERSLGFPLADGVTESHSRIPGSAAGTYTINGNAFAGWRGPGELRHHVQHRSRAAHHLYADAAADHTLFSLGLR